ncbi:MAG: mechanosensitive ion channel [Proteobacteria bacterium]|nr:mechanosensitive ion channel [Pseudomonadota bacterium]
MTRLLFVLAWLCAVAAGALAAGPENAPDAQPAAGAPAAAPQAATPPATAPLGPPPQAATPVPAPPPAAAQPAPVQTAPAPTTPASPAPSQAAPTPAPSPPKPQAARPSGGARPAAASPANGITPEQARLALDVVNDPAKRAAFTATLNALIKAGTPAQAATPAGQPAPAGAEQPPAQKTTVEGIAIPLAPDSLGAQVLVSASSFVNQLGNQAVDAFDAAQSLPLLWGWLVVMATNPTARDLLQDVLWRLVLAVAASGLVGLALQWGMQRPIRSLEAIAPPNAPELEDGENAAPETAAAVEPDVTEAPEPVHNPLDDSDPAPAADSAPPKPAASVLLRRVPLVLARLVLELVPVLGIVVTGHLIAASSVGGHEISRLIILAVVDAFAVCMAILSIARMLLSPRKSRMRLFHLPDSAAAYLMRWVRVIVLVAVLGYALGEVGLLLGLSEDGYELLHKSIALVLHILIAFVIIRKRRTIRYLLRAPADQAGFTAALRNRAAAVWHWVALFFLFGGWLVWAIEVPHGFTALLRYSSITAIVLIGARLTIVVILGVIERGMRPGSNAASLNARLGTYYPVAALAVRLTIWVLCFLGLLQLYGANTFIWLATSALGLRVVNTSVTILLTVVVALTVWEAANAGVHRHLDKLQAQAQLGRSARLRTLLPLLRTTLFICIAIFAGLTILSEIGINVAPLLAGAGIVGVAIGFGSQKLVQDLINGIFLLLENAMQVGDYVTVSGLSGTVEALSVRAIRLRAADGSVHLIPFSAVTSVTNVNRGLGNASVNVTVAYQEDTDRVMAELRTIVSEMRNDTTLSAQMLGDLQLWGVDRVDGGGVTITGQIVCTDTGRWPVQREFNRRMKKRFQELGIRMFNPLQRIEVAAIVPPERRPDPRLGPGQSHAAD